MLDRCRRCDISPRDHMLQLEDASINTISLELSDEQIAPKTLSAHPRVQLIERHFCVSIDIEVCATKRDMRAIDYRFWQTSFFARRL